MYEVLIAHLRECAKLDASNNTYTEAADAIEELSKALDAVNDAHNEGYDVGYWAGRRDYEPKWIPVTERLPSEDGFTLIFTAHGHAGVCYFTNGWWGGYDKGGVTHWMPLPEPPKEE